MNLSRRTFLGGAAGAAAIGSGAWAALIRDGIHQAAPIISNPTTTVGPVSSTTVAAAQAATRLAEAKAAEMAAALRAEEVRAAWRAAAARADEAATLMKHLLVQIRIARIRQHVS